MPSALPLRSSETCRRPRNFVYVRAGSIEAPAGWVGRWSHHPTPGCAASLARACRRADPALHRETCFFCLRARPSAPPSRDAAQDHSALRGVWSEANHAVGLVEMKQFPLGTLLQECADAAEMG